MSHNTEPANKSGVLPGVDIGAGFIPRVRPGGKIANKDPLCSLFPAALMLMVSSAGNLFLAGKRRDNADKDGESEDSYQQPLSEDTSSLYHTGCSVTCF